MNDFRRPRAALPVDIEGERAILGLLMLWGSDKAAGLLHTTRSKLKPEDLHQARHRALYRLICRRDDAGDPIELLTIATDPEVESDPDTFGGVSYVCALGDSVPSAESLPYLLRRVVGTAERRRFILAARRAAEAAAEGQDLDACRAIVEPDRDGPAGSLRSASATSGDAWAEIVGRWEARQDGRAVGLPMPWTALSSWVTATAGDLVILAGRPAMGKTALALNLVDHVASTGSGVAVFSLEMTATELYSRLAGRRVGVPPERIKSSFVSAQDMDRLAESFRALGELPLWVDDTPGQTIDEIRRKARRLAGRAELGLVVVDHIGLCSAATSGQQNSARDRVGYVSRICKEMAKELGVVVVALSQLNRAVEKRQNRLPNMADLRDSGEVEQDADVIAFLYREEYYLKEMTPFDLVGRAQVIIAKQRAGRTGSALLAFDGPLMAFSDVPEGGVRN